MRVVLAAKSILIASLLVGGCAGEPGELNGVPDSSADLADSDASLDAGDVAVPEGPRGTVSCPGDSIELHFAEGARCLPVPPEVPPLSCQQAWAETDLGGCVPERPPTECPPGEFPILGQECARVSSCEVRSDASLRELFGGIDATIWRVQPGQLATTIVGAAPGDVLALAAGEYVGQFDVSGLNVVGVCAAETLVRSEDPSTGLGAINATRGPAEIHEISVGGNAIGVWIAGDADVVMRGVEVNAARRIGVRVAGGATADLAQVWVHDMLPSFEDESFGRGIQVSADSSAVLRDVTIQNVRDIGLVAIDTGASVVFDNLAVATVIENHDPSAPGNGVQAFANDASITGTRLAVWDTQSAALVSSGGRVDVEHVYIEGLAVPDTFEFGVRGAVRSIGTGILEARSVTITGADGPGLQVDAHAEAIITGWRVHEITGPLIVGDELGVAVVSDVVAETPSLLSASNGANITFDNADLTATSTLVALEISNASRVLLRRTHLGASGPAAEVVGSTLNIEDATIEAAAGVTLGGSGEWARTALVVAGSGLSVLGPFAGSDLELSIGDGPALTISNGRGEIGSSYIGGSVRLAGGEFLLRDSVLDASAPAIEVGEGELTVERVAVVGDDHADVTGGTLVDVADAFTRP